MISIDPLYTVYGVLEVPKRTQYSGLLMKSHGNREMLTFFKFAFFGGAVRVGRCKFLFLGGWENFLWSNF